MSFFHSPIDDFDRRAGRVKTPRRCFIEGEALLLLRLMERKFKPLPKSARKRIAEADAETLLVWGERLLDANTLDEIWGH